MTRYIAAPQPNKLVPPGLTSAGPSFFFHSGAFFFSYSLSLSFIHFGLFFSFLLQLVVIYAAGEAADFFKAVKIFLAKYNIAGFCRIELCKVARSIYIAKCLEEAEAPAQVQRVLCIHRERKLNMLSSLFTNQGGPGWSMYKPYTLIFLQTGLRKDGTQYEAGNRNIHSFTGEGVYFPELFKELGRNQGNLLIIASDTPEEGLYINLFQVSAGSVAFAKQQAADEKDKQIQADSQRRKQQVNQNDGNRKAGLHQFIKGCETGDKGANSYLKDIQSHDYGFDDVVHYKGYGGNQNG